MKRILSLSLVLITLIAILAGCGTANRVYRRTHTGDRPVIDRAVTDHARSGYPLPSGRGHTGRGYHNRAANNPNAGRFDGNERATDMGGYDAGADAGFGYGIGGTSPTTVPGIAAMTPATPPANNEAKRAKPKAPQAQNPANPNGGTSQRTPAPTPPAA